MRGMWRALFVLAVFCVVSLHAQDPFTIIDPYPGDKYTSNGASWGDFNNDGYEDVFVGNGSQGYKFEDFLYLNNGDGTFTKITGQAIVTEVHLSGGGTWGDFDNDGDLDIYIAITEDSFLGSDLQNLLYVNDGSGNFTKSTTAGPPVTDSEKSNTAGWADYDLDGDLDLFVKNGWQGFTDQQSLYKNDGSGLFTDVNAGDLTGSAGAALIAGFAWCDYDMDGDPDIFQCHGGGGNDHLWRNDGNDTFTDIGGFSAQFSNGCSWGDYDNDGDFDLFVANYGDAAPENNELWDNNGDGTFTLNSSSILSSDGGWSLGSAWGDIDNDGDLDLFVANDYEYNTNPNFLYINNGDGTFTKNTTSVAVTDPASQAPHGVAFADYDNDGFLDLFAGVYGPNFMLVNNGNSNNWIEIKLEGTTSNRSAIGSTVWATATINGSVVTQLREISSQTGMGSQNSMRAHFGFGNSSGPITEIRVEFPSGKTVTKSNVAMNQILTISEAEAPISVKLTEFSAHLQSDGSVEITWQTASEINTAGFNILRSNNKNRGYERINAELIKSTGSAATGSCYMFVDEHVPLNDKLYYRLAEISLNGDGVWHEPREVSTLTRVEEQSSPKGFQLLQNFPNPFNPTTAITFQLSEASDVRLEIYDLRGTKVKSLINNPLQAGRHTIQWDGTNLHGQLVPSGVYLYKMRTKGDVAVKKMILAR